MSIYTEYRVIVEVPEDTYRNFSEKTDYQIRVSEAIKGYLEAGANFYDTPFEWATFNSLEEAERAESLLLKVVDYFTDKVPK